MVLSARRPPLSHSFRKIRRRAMTHMFPIAVQKEDGTTQSFRLTFHEENKAGKHIRQRGVGRDHFQHATLSGSKKFLFFDLGDIAANDDTA